MAEKISIVVPMYNEEPSITIFYKTLCEKLSIPEFANVDFEFIFIDDGSKDKCLSLVKGFAETDERVRYYSFSRNFGKEAAMYAGFEKSTGDYVVVMDADLQDPPELLYTMYQAIKEEGFDSCATRRVTRKGEPKVRSFFARMFYKIINRISDIDVVDGARDYRLMTRQMVDAILSMGEYNRFSKGIFGWIGFNTKWIEYENRNRVAGETKWSFFKLLKYSVSGIVDFSNAPIVLSSYLGFFLCLFAAIVLIFLVVRQLIYGNPVVGWTSTACIIVFIGGVQLFCIGIIGQYIAKTYLETKNRPKYIVKEDNEGTKKE